jgi:dihydrofolate reductase
MSAEGRGVMNRQTIGDAMTDHNVSKQTNEKHRIRAMTRVVYYAAMSLDGYIAETDDTIDWLTSYAGQPPADEVEPIERGYEDFYRRVGALVCGSVTYEWILDHISRGGDWPYAGKPCWILSSRELRVLEGDVDVRVVDGSVSELFERMAESAGDADLWVVGGGNVASQFADTGLLDEVRVTVVPVVLGAGKPLFDRRVGGEPMRLVGAPKRNGMVELAYELAGRP